MPEPSQPISSDPWETPPAHFDPELIETSRRLMAKSTPTLGLGDPLVNTSQDPKAAPIPDDHVATRHETPSGSAGATPPPTDPKDLLIAQLEQEKQRLFQRNVRLVTEATQLRVENQHLLQQISEKQHSQNWLTRLLKQLRQTQQKN